MLDPLLPTGTPWSAGQGPGAAPDYDLIIVGAGAAGVIAADFAVQFGARVALVEKDRIGGDCTWTGCVPSKALVKVARTAQAVRDASRYGVGVGAPVMNMTGVRDYIRQTIDQIDQHTSPDQLRQKGIDVILGGARLLDAHSLMSGDRVLRSRTMLLATGARPRLPAIKGLSDVAFLTYRTLFDNDRLPRHMVIVGGGPVGAETAQAYRRLGAAVTLVAEHLLPREDPAVQTLMRSQFEVDGIRLVRARATAVRKDGDHIVVAAGDQEVHSDLLLVATGRSPVIDGLDLDRAGVRHSQDGIAVDEYLRTSVGTIYAAGDVVGGPQFSHYAGWQAFQAVRNALFPGSSRGITDFVPRVTFTDPEVASVGMSENQARAMFGEPTAVDCWPMARTDRAVCEDATGGFVKLVAAKGRIVGAVVVCSRAGEVINELAVAIRNRLKVSDLAGTIHAYPTYSTPVQQLATRMAVDESLSGVSGEILRVLSRASHQLRRA